MNQRCEVCGGPTDNCSVDRIEWDVQPVGPKGELLAVQVPAGEYHYRCREHRHEIRKVLTPAYTEWIETQKTPEVAERFREHLFKINSLIADLGRFPGIVGSPNALFQEEYRALIQGWSKLADALNERFPFSNLSR